AAALALEVVPEELVSCVGDLDPVRRALRLHPARDVDRVTPEVVQEPLPADDAGDDRARVDPDAQLEPEVADAIARSGGLDHVEGEEGKDPGVVGSRVGDARGDHVAVADGLDLLEA